MGQGGKGGRCMIHRNGRHEQMKRFLELSIFDFLVMLTFYLRGDGRIHFSPFLE